MAKDDSTGMDVSIGKFNCYIFDEGNGTQVHVQCPAVPDGTWTDLWQLEEGWGFSPYDDDPTQYKISKGGLKHLVSELKKQGLYY